MNNKLYAINRKLLYKELAPVFKELSSVRYAVVKGEALSQLIYGVPDCRKSNDIDILIDKKNVNYLETHLRKLGYMQKLPPDNMEVRRNRILCMSCSHQIPSYHKEMCGFYFNVDINHDIFWGEYEGDRYSIDEFLSDTIDMEIYGTMVKTLAHEKAFVQLILHHYKEMNSLYHLSHHNPIRTDMFKDVYDLLNNNQEILDTTQVERLSEKYSIIDYCYYMLFYVNEIYSDNLSKQYVSILADKANHELLECFGLNAAERKKWDISFTERLNSKNLFKVISEIITEDDRLKIINNNSIFT